MFYEYLYVFIFLFYSLNTYKYFYFYHDLLRLSVDMNIQTASFLSTVQTAAAVISSNSTAMAHALCSALIVRKLIHSGPSALSWSTITECVSALSDHSSSSSTSPLIEELRAELAAVRTSFDSKVPFVDACESYGKACAYPGMT